MKEIAPILEKLANQLGTTATYLWEVLIRQAFVSGIQDIAFIVLTAIYVGILYKLHGKYSKPPEDRYYNSYYDKGDYIAPIMIIAAIIGIFCSIISIVCVFTAITAFVNPEYWALDRILGAIGRCK